MEVQEPHKNTAPVGLSNNSTSHTEKTGAQTFAKAAVFLFSLQEGLSPSNHELRLKHA